MTQVEQIARILAGFASRHGTLCEGEEPEDNWEAWEEEATAIHTEVIRPLVEREAALRTSCEYLLACIDMSIEAGAPVDESDPEDIAAIDEIRTTLSQEPQG